MFIQYQDREIECVTTLRVAMNLQTKFRKPYMRVLESIEGLELQEQAKILYAGIELGKDKDIKFNDFLDYIVDGGMGLDGLGECLEDFVNGLQYPGLSEEEIEKKLIAKAEKQKKMREIGLIR